MNLNRAPAVYLLFCLVAVFCGDCFAAKSMVDFFVDDGQYYHRPGLVPIKYHDFNHELVVDVAGAISTERWDIDVCPGSRRESIIYMPSFLLKDGYEYINAYMIGRGGGRIVLPIKHKTSVIEDGKGRVMKFKTPYAIVPAGKLTQRIIVKFRRRISDAGMIAEAQQLVLAPEVSVDKATLLIRHAVTAGVPSEPAFEAEGFVQTENRIDHGYMLSRYELKQKWQAGTESSTATRAPRIFVSFLNWGDIADRHGRYYKAALAAADGDALLRALGISMIQPSGSSTEEVRETAYELYKLVGNNFTYTPSDFSLNEAENFGPKSLEMILRSKKGACKEFALVYIKLLAMAGVSAEPVEVNVMPNAGAIPIDTIVPFGPIFNHVIVYIPAIDEYIDPTSGDPVKSHGARFATESAEYANAPGLHLFTKRFLLIKPGLKRNDISIETVVENQHGEWVVSTTWTGSHHSHEMLAMIVDRRNKVLKEGKPYRAFEKVGGNQGSHAWVIDRDDLHARTRIDFSYSLNSPPVTPEGQLLYIPKNAMTLALLRYDGLEAYQAMGYPCFASEVSSERIEIKGVGSAELPVALRQAHFSGINSDYVQSITLDKGSLILERHFTLDERRAYCTDHEVSVQRQYYKDIRAVTDATHAH